MKGWESWYRVSQAKNGWGSNSSGSPIYLDTESDGLNINRKLEENDSRLVYGRFSGTSTRTIRGAEPGGNIGFVPRADDLFLFMASLFQSVTASISGGTVVTAATFAPIQDAPDWVGSTWGNNAAFIGTASDVYPLNIEKCFGLSLTGEPNGIAFRSGIVTQLELTANYGEDVKVTPTFGFYSSDETIEFTGADAPGVAGSYSSNSRFADYNVSFNINGAGLSSISEFTNIKLTFDNKNSARGKIGKEGPYKYSFSGRPSFMVELQGEYLTGSVFLAMKSQEDINGTISLMSSGGTYSFFYPELRMNPSDVNPSGGDSDIEQTLELRAYPNASGLLPFCIATGLTVGTNLVTLP